MSWSISLLKSLPQILISHLLENRPPIITQDSLADLDEEDSLSTVFLTDLWVNHNPDKAAKFLEPIPSNEFHIEAMGGDDFVDRSLYDDGGFSGVGLQLTTPSRMLKE